MSLSKTSLDVPLSHERLHAYQVALEFCRLAHRVARRLPKAKGQLGDQLSRASESIVLCIAEGAGGEFHSPQQRNFFRIARGSALECAAILDVVAIRGQVTKTELAQGRELIIRIVKMLSRLVGKGT